MGWQPIETAPKDELVDIWLSDGRRWCDCYYDRICDEWRTSRPSGRLVRIKSQHVTRWMPRPDAPYTVTRTDFSQTWDASHGVAMPPELLADLPEVKAMVAAAVMEAAETAYQWHNDDDAQELRAAIRALIRPDAKAALDAHVAAEVREARDKALREAMDACADYPRWSPDYDEWTRYDEQIAHSQDCIRALIQEAPQ